MPRLKFPLRLLGSDDTGAIAVTFALMLIPLLLAIGAAIDYSRGQQFRSALQQAADSAALAGASAYVNAAAASTATTVANASMTASVTQLPPHTGTVTFTATPSTAVVNGSTGYQMSVTAQGSVSTTVLALLTSSIATSATAEAMNSPIALTVVPPSGTSNASDTNTVYWYVVPADGSLPTLSSSNVVYSNASSWRSSTASTPAAMASQKIGFALVNVTGGNSSYGNNGYNASPGSTHTFYSSVMPPSKYATDNSDRNRETYSSQPKNCSLQVLPVPNPASPPNASSGSCFTSVSDLATPTCAQLGNQTVKYFWNDMGGGGDDYDYNDAVYTVSCKSSGNGTGASGVVLIR